MRIKLNIVLNIVLCIGLLLVGFIIWATASGRTIPGVLLIIGGLVCSAGLLIRLSRRSLVIVFVSVIILMTIVGLIKPYGPFVTSKYRAIELVKNSQMYGDWVRCERNTVEIMGGCELIGWKADKIDQQNYLVSFTYTLRDRKETFGLWFVVNLTERTVYLKESKDPFPPCEPCEPKSRISAEKQPPALIDD